MTTVTCPGATIRGGCPPTTVGAALCPETGEPPLPSKNDVPTVTVCRGCCCGTDKKRPGVDHEARLDTLRDLLGQAAMVRVTDCLGPCERSDVIVVSPSPAGRRAGARPVWLGQLNGRHEHAAIADWVYDGGPGFADLPESLRRSKFAQKGPVPRR